MTTGRTPGALPVLRSLRDLADLVERRPGLFLRWSPDPTGEPETSVDGLTGIDMPDLSCNGLDPEPWWRDQPVQLWVARRLHQYSPEREDT